MQRVKYIYVPIMMAGLMSLCVSSCVPLTLSRMMVLDALLRDAAWCSSSSSFVASNFSRRRFSESSPQPPQRRSLGHLIGCFARVQPSGALPASFLPPFLPPSPARSRRVYQPESLDLLYHHYLLHGLPIRLSAQLGGACRRACERKAAFLRAPSVSPRYARYLK